MLSWVDFGKVVIIVLFQVNFDTVTKHISNIPMEYKSNNVGNLNLSLYNIMQVLAK